MEFRKDQWMAVIIMTCVNMFTSSIYSLQAPFYPAEAQQKGASATEYGLVLGLYELTAFLVGPLVRKIIRRYPLQFLSSGGMIVGSIAIILFGFVDRISNTALFVAVSIILRIIEAIGTTISIVSGFSLIGAMFEDDIATVFATLEIFYGCGFILGPAMGGFLYQIGGFSFPFFFFGVIGIIIAISIFVLYRQISTEPSSAKTEKYETISALKVPEIALNLGYMALFMTGMALCTALLEPHLRQFKLSPSMTSLFFVINGLTYTFVSPILGKLVDKGLEPRILLITSCVLAIGGFTIIGPLPIIPYNATIISCIIALIILGFAFGASNIATFTDSFRSIRKAGFPDSIETFGLISGLWTSSVALGAFLGPIIGGVLYDHVGFRWATQYVTDCFIVTLILMIVFIIITNKYKREKHETLEACTTTENTPLLD